MRNLKTPFAELLVELVIASLLVTGMASTAWADTTTTRDDSVTVIHLDEYDDHFAAEETPTSLRAGEYEFVVSKRMKHQYHNRSASEFLTPADNDLLSRSATPADSSTSPPRWISRRARRVSKPTRPTKLSQSVAVKRGGQ